MQRLRRPARSAVLIHDERGLPIGAHTFLPMGWKQKKKAVRFSALAAFLLSLSGVAVYPAVILTTREPPSRS